MTRDDLETEYRQMMKSSEPKERFAGELSLGLLHLVEKTWNKHVAKRDDIEPDEIMVVLVGQLCLLAGLICTQLCDDDNVDPVVAGILQVAHDTLMSARRLN